MHIDPSEGKRRGTGVRRECLGNSTGTRKTNILENWAAKKKLFCRGKCTLQLGLLTGKGQGNYGTFVMYQLNLTS